MTTDEQSRALTVHLSGELDHHGATALREQVDAAVRRSMPRRLRLDFSDVSFMDSSGIGFVMGRYRLMTASGGTLSVVGTTARMKRVMELAGLQRLPIWEKEETT